MGSKSPSTTTQTNKVELSPAQEEISQLGLPLARQYAKSKLELPNYSIAGFSPDEVAAQNMARDQAYGGMTDLSQQAATTNKFLLDPALLDPSSNPYLQQQGNAIQQHMTQNLTESILPALRTGSVVAGGLNSGGATKQGLATGMAVGRTNQEIGNALSSLYSNAYSTGLGAMGQAVQANPSVMKGLLYPSTIVSGIGGQIRGMEQAQIDNAAQQQWLSQMLPFYQAQNIYSLMGTMPGGSGVSTVTGAQPQSNPAMSGLGGAASGAVLGSMIMPGIGTAAGAGIGGLLGLLS